MGKNKERMESVYGNLTSLRELARIVDIPNANANTVRKILESLGVLLRNGRASPKYNDFVVEYHDRKCSSKRGTGYRVLFTEDGVSKLGNRIKKGRVINVRPRKLPSRLYRQEFACEGEGEIKRNC